MTDWLLEAMRGRGGGGKFAEGMARVNAGRNQIFDETPPQNRMEFGHPSPAFEGEMAIMVPAVQGMPRPTGRYWYCWEPHVWLVPENEYEAYKAIVPEKLRFMV